MVCRLFVVILIWVVDGGFFVYLKVFYIGEVVKFVYFVWWLCDGCDKFVLIGGEENFIGWCELNNSEFLIYSVIEVFYGGFIMFGGSFD